MGDRFISMSEVLDRICLSKTHLYRKINAGQFPRPVPLGPQKVAFLESEIETWIAARLQARDQDEGMQARRERARKSANSADHVVAAGGKKDGVRDDG
jgi:prophage regulatory protein